MSDQNRSVNDDLRSEVVDHMQRAPRPIHTSQCHYSVPESQR